LLLPMAASEAKFKEGMRHQAAAEKAVTKTMFKWSADWEVGAAEFNQAASNFKAAKAHEQAKEAFVRAAECLIQQHSAIMAGAAYENAAQMAYENGTHKPTEMKHFEEAAELYEKASATYMEGGNSDRAASALAGGAKALASVSVDKSLALYVQACDLYESEGREQFANETFVATINMMVKNSKLDDALRMLERHHMIYRKLDRKAAMCKTTLSRIVVSLSKNDEIGARSVYDQALGDDGFGGSDEANAAQDLFEAVKSGDQATVDATTKKPAFMYLDNEIAKLARTIKASGEGESIGLA